ncbi:unnamed protein product [Danaus chrysippus]|uniref:(African queen) hypothetical protein n=1 Tax=Danaus chrysippus TaxID=151541 RepID=A0A8J2W4B1_9NEOP|nr:unnamed protein product [Danaus chrysippus]
MLTSTKAAVTDHRVTKVVIDFLKKNAEIDQNSKLTSDECTNISNGLLLLRNILHIPEEINKPILQPSYRFQNQILWNLFSQSIDKVLIKIDEYHGRGSDDSSPMLTSDPTSDSSDTGASAKDLIVTNHILLMFLDSVMKLPQYEGPNAMVDHIKHWSEEEISSLNWNYMQCNTAVDVVEEILRMLKEDGIVKTRESIIKELYRQLIINKEEFEKLSKVDSDKNSKSHTR